jgi:hypothetical protein
MVSMWQLLTDPVEGPLLMPLLQDQPDAAAWGRYQAWLQGQGDPRGEAMALAVRLSEPGELPGREALATRLAELLERVPEGWWRLVCTVPWVLSCGQAAAEPIAVRFAFECPRSWESLQPTRDPSVRRCDGCAQEVILCDSQAQAAQQALRGRCIAVPRALVAKVSRETTAHITGRPHVPTLWAARLFPDR